MGVCFSSYTYPDTTTNPPAASGRRSPTAAEGLAKANSDFQLIQLSVGGGPDSSSARSASAKRRLAQRHGKKSDPNNSERFREKKHREHSSVQDASHRFEKPARLRPVGGIRSDRVGWVESVTSVGGCGTSATTSKVLASFACQGCGHWASGIIWPAVRGLSFRGIYFCTKDISDCR